ncbi:MAG: Na+/H+ antiporter NhaC family protein, partial [Clostridia bacterium]|nr:Na+/H+ antiporter NhaC family protein [Clostridia bacterium]
SFANTNSSLALAIGSIIALAIIIAYFSITKVVTFKDCTESFTQGFKSMVPAILILVFAWTIGGIMGAKGGYLDAQGFVNTTLASTGFPTWLFPAIFFILACVISFSTGTSWGTFGVLIPLAVSIVGTTANVQVFLTISAILSGAVFGDHVSPISDTTIMASSGAQCNHVDHVKTQLPYAGLVACVCAVSYFILGLILQNVTKYWVGMLVTLGIGFGLLVCAIVVIKLIQLRKKDNDEEIATDETVSVVE